MDDKIKRGLLRIINNSEKEIDKLNKKRSRCDSILMDEEILLEKIKKLEKILNLKRVEWGEEIIFHRYKRNNYEGYTDEEEFKFESCDVINKIKEYINLELDNLKREYEHLEKNNFFIEEELRISVDDIIKLGQ